MGIFVRPILEIAEKVRYIEIKFLYNKKSVQRI